MAGHLRKAYEGGRRLLGKLFPARQPRSGTGDRTSQGVKMEAPKPDIKFLLAKGWKIRIGADTQTMRLVVKVGHPQLQQHAAVSYTVQEVARGNRDRHHRHDGRCHGNPRWSHAKALIAFSLLKPEGRL